MIRIVSIGLLVLWTIGFLIAIALLVSSAPRVARRRDRPYGLRAEAGDPFQYPFGEMPTIPRERHLVARDFRAWGIPQVSHSAGALRRNESGGRPAFGSGTAVVLTFPRLLKPDEVEQMNAFRQHQIEEIARVFGGSVEKGA